jgi:hypothetical protein
LITQPAMILEKPMSLPPTLIVMRLVFPSIRFSWDGSPDLPDRTLRVVAPAQAQKAVDLNVNDLATWK